MTLSTSSSMNPAANSDRLIWGRSSRSKFINLCLCDGVPRTSLKNSKRALAFWPSSTRVWPSCCNDRMNFFLQRPLACMWKRLVGASPSFIHAMHDSCLAMVLRSDDITNGFNLISHWRCSSWVMSCQQYLAASSRCTTSLEISSCDLMLPTWRSLQLLRKHAMLNRSQLSREKGPTLPRG
jgi:hypothetical protein